MSRDWKSAAEVLEKITGPGSSEHMLLSSTNNLSEDFELKGLSGIQLARFVSQSDMDCY